MFATVKKALEMLPPKRRVHWLSIIPLAITAAGLEALVAGITFSLLAISSNPTRPPRLPGPSFLYEWLPTGPYIGIRFFILAVAVSFIGKNVFLLAKESFQHRVVQHSTADLSKRLLRGYLASSYALHRKRSAAELVRNVTASVDTAFSQVLGAAVSLMTESLVALGITCVLMVAAPMVTMGAIAVLLVILLPLLLLSRRTVVRWGAAEHEVRATMLQTLQQGLAGFKEVRVAGREEYFYGAFASAIDRFATLRHRFQTLSALPRLLVETTMIGGMLLVVGLATTVTPGPEALSLFGLYGYAAFRLIPSANRMMMHLNVIRHGSTTVDKLHHDHSTFGVADPRQAMDEASDMAFNELIELSRVGFTYPGGTQPALRDIDLGIRRGECIGVVGPTGAGKSTLIDIVLGLLQPTTGCLEVDGVNVAFRTRAWQKLLGYVPQDIYLVDDTLLSNVAFGLPPDRIDVAKVERALERAQLAEFTAALPEGLATTVGERGVRLSGGERQRVGIARALYRDPEVIIFDEATSALDNRTEREVMRALEAIRTEKTLILIAHRLSTVQSCDRLFFLQGGAIEGSGSYDQLLESCPGFRAMVGAEDGA